MERQKAPTRPLPEKRLLDLDSSDPEETGTPKFPRMEELDPVMKGISTLEKIQAMARNCSKNPKTYWTQQKCRELVAYAEELKEVITDLGDGVALADPGTKGAAKERDIITKMVIEAIVEAKATPAMSSVGRTYAGVTAAQQQDQLLKRPSRNNKATMLIYGTKEGSTSGEVEKTLKQLIKPRDHGARVRRVGKIRNGGVALELEDPKHIESFQKELAGHLKVKMPAKRFPKVMIYDVPREQEQEELATQIYHYNFKDCGMTETDFNDCFSLKFKTGPRDRETTNWVAECAPKIYKQLMNTGAVHFEWTRHKVVEFLRPTRCYKCQKYGHLSKVCRSEVVVCGHCSKIGHERGQCPNKQAPPRCCHCASGKNAHQTESKECPRLKLEVVRLRDLIDYG